MSIAPESPTTARTSGAAGIVLAGVDGRITYWSDGAAVLFEHTAAEAVGRPVDLIIPDACRAAHWAGFRRAVGSGNCKLDRAATNLPTVHRDGTERRFVFLTDARDTVVGAMAVFAAPAGDEVPWGAIVALVAAP